MIEGVVRRLAVAMPRIDVKVMVQTAQARPVSSVKVEAIPDDPFNSLRVTGETDAQGYCRLRVPACLPFHIKAYHDILMVPQERQVSPISEAIAETFEVENVVQLWQVETPQELVVYCTCPRLTQKPPELVHPSFKALPFQGHLECTSGLILTPEATGCLRGAPSLLNDVNLVVLRGWHSATLSKEAQIIFENETCTPIIATRLDIPTVKVSCVAACCGAHIAQSRISVNGTYFGTSGVSELPLQCGIKAGEHTLQAGHRIMPNVVSMPIQVKDAVTPPVQIPLPLDCLRFVCFAFATDRKSVV